MSISIRTRGTSPSPTHPPTWADVVDATITGQATGYAMGYAAAMHDTADELDADLLRRAAAAVIRGAVADMGVNAARDKADTYPDARGPIRRPA